MKYLILVLSFALLPACATTAKYQAELQTWIGKSENELLSSWGIPSQTYPMNDGSKLVLFEKAGGSSTMRVGSGFVTSANYCKTTFTVGADSIVKAWKIDGNQCQAY